MHAKDAQRALRNVVEIMLNTFHITNFVAPTEKRFS
jgi:hypothetical protein